VLFTAGEQARAQAQPDPTAALALAFAAKEAFVKALQRGLTATGPDAWLRQVEVAPGPGGRPALALGEAPRRALAARSLGAPVLALARDARHALATVLLVPAADVVKEGA
jgi:phosphopantetheinyl transferase (holo-ACP synthase)